MPDIPQLARTSTRRYRKFPPVLVTISAAASAAIGSLAVTAALYLTAGAATAPTAVTITVAVFLGYHLGWYVCATWHQQIHQEANRG